MARGKQTCKILKDIRRQVAEANDIEYITSECQFQGDCAGTCPKCEAELRYLENQLTIRRLTGKAIVLVGLTAGMLTMQSCSNQHKSSDAINPEYDEAYNVDVWEGDDDEWLEGEVVPDDYFNESSETAVNTPESLPLSKPIYCGEDEEFFKQQDSLRQQEPEIQNQEPEIYNIALVDSQPEFPNGYQAMYEWLESNIHYPKFVNPVSAKDSTKRYDRVIVELIIDHTGVIENVKLLRGPGSLTWDVSNGICDTLKLMPAWTPATKNGKNVKVSTSLPINFEVPEQEISD